MTLDLRHLSTLVCVCGAKIGFHRDRNNRQMSCYFARRRQRAFDRREASRTAICETCGCGFVPRDKYLANGRVVRYCSKSCAGKAHVKLASAALTPELRQLAGRRGGNANAAKHQAAGHTHLVLRGPCKACGSKFLAQRSNVRRGGGIFCSPACAFHGKRRPQLNELQRAILGLRAIRSIEKVTFIQRHGYARNYQLHGDARRTYRAAMRHKVLRPLDHCERCGSDRYVDGHHEDYAQPLAVRWLCRSCHQFRHFEIAFARLGRGDEPPQAPEHPYFATPEGQAELGATNRSIERVKAHG